MTRKKVTLAYIPNDSERKASYKKRKKGLIKKVEELTTLCGVQACAIIYSPYEPEPVVWPSLAEAQNVLTRFNNMSMMDRTRKMVNQEGFTRQRVKKAEDQLRRLQRENKRIELELYMHQCITGNARIQRFDINDAAEMNLVINNNIREINARMEALPGQNQGNASADDALLPPPPQPMQDFNALPPPPPPHVVAPQPAPDLMDGFPWSLVVESPRTGGVGYEPGEVGFNYWEEHFMQPYYPHFYSNADHGSTSGNPPGDNSN